MPNVEKIKIYSVAHRKEFNIASINSNFEAVSPRNEGKLSTGLWKVFYGVGNKFLASGHRFECGKQKRKRFQIGLSNNVRLFCGVFRFFISLL